MPHPTVSKRIFHVQLWNRFARKANNKTQSLNRGQYTTDLTATAVAVLEHYGGRWTIEETFRATKQRLRTETPQSWTAWGPERVVVCGFLTYGLVWFWYLLTQGNQPAMVKRLWYRTQRTPSFVDALADLRTHLWGVRMNGEGPMNPGSSKIDDDIIRILAEAG